MAKTGRKFIRINGTLYGSPTGLKGPALKEWVRRMQDRKKFIEHGFLSGKVPTFMEYTLVWIKKRMQQKGKSTWYSDEQRLRTYLLPHLSELPMDKITRSKMKAVLEKVTEPDPETGVRNSISTRRLVQALASKIFTDAMNEDPPLVQGNPISRLKFDDKRQGKRKPKTLEDKDEILSYLRAATQVGPTHLVIAALGVMAGLRKSEKIPLRWRNIKWKRSVIEVDSHCEQASLSILPGTKAGSQESREVRVPQELIQLLLWFKDQSPLKGEDDFILSDEKGDWIRPRVFHDLVIEIADKFGRHLTDHELRHSFGRHFAAKTGNLKVLQQLLGHKSLSTTMIYAELSGRQMEEYGETASYGITRELLD